jgi:hypothetical protein
LGDMIEALEYLNRRHRKIKPKWNIFIYFRK